MVLSLEHYASLRLAKQCFSSQESWSPTNPVRFSKDFDAELKECNGESDHVHMLIQYPPTVQLSKLVNNLKSVTSRRMRNEFLDLRGNYTKPVLWSRSYFAGSCGGAPLEIIKQYIQNQQG